MGNDLAIASRLLHKCKNYFDSIVPEQQIEELPETKLREKWEESKKQSLMHFDEFQFSQGLNKSQNLFVQLINMPMKGCPGN